MSAEEEMVISTKTGKCTVAVCTVKHAVAFNCTLIIIDLSYFLLSGHLCGVEWDGKFDENFRLNISIPLSSSQVHFQQHPPAKKDHHHHHSHSTNSYIRDFKYSTIIGGFSLVFYNGLGAFLPLTETTNTNPTNPNLTNANPSSIPSSQPPPPTTPSYSQLQLISHVDSALCTAINHKYALIAYGLTASDGVLCGFDEIDRRFIVSHRLALPANSYPEVEQYLGPVTALQWTPDSAVLATAWANGGFALWTVFGSLLTCSLGWSYSPDVDCGSGNSSRLYAGPYRVASLAFGKEGYHLWMATKRSTIL